MAILNNVLKAFGIILLIAVLAFFLWPEKRYKPHQVSTAYQAQIDAFHLPDMPPDWKWHQFEANDGTVLRWGETGNNGAAKATLILIPGYTATLSMYGEHIDMLGRRGYHVVGLDLRGQGGSERHRKHQPEKLWVSDFSVYSDDLASFIQSLPKEERPIIPIGVSFGGHVSIRMAGDYPNLVDGLYLMAPAIVPKAGELPFSTAKNLMDWARRLGKGKRYLQGNDNWTPFRADLSVANIDLCASNPDRLPYRDVVFTRDPAQRVGGVTAQWGSEFFESSVYIRKAGYLESITVPMTIVSASVDHFVETNENQQACDNRLGDCVRLDMIDAGHCLLQESDAHLEQMFDAVDALLARINNLTSN